MRTRARRSAVALLGAGALSLAAACGGSSGGSPSSQGSSAPAGAHMGGTLKLVGVSDIDGTDPAAWYFTTDYEIANLIARQLLTYPRDPSTGKFGTTPVGDAADLPKISSDGKTYTFTIKQGVKWDTTPARQVTAADFARGLARTCNPVKAFGASSYLTSTIVGFKKFCDGELKIGTSAAALKNYINAHLSEVSGIQASGETLTFHLIQPASDFNNILALPFASAVPVEYMKYAPNSAALGQHYISDGPYKVDKYVPGKSWTFSRNPAWERSTDPNRPSYVDNIDITTGLTQQAVQQQIQAGTADMEFDTFPLPSQVPQLNRVHDPNLRIDPTSSNNPYVVFNTVSPNNNGALSKIPVRQALEYAADTAHMLQVCGGPLTNNPIHQVLPADIAGSSPAYNLYPYDPNKAKSMLQAAGATNLTLKVLYANTSTCATSAAQVLQSDFKKVGVHVTLVPAPIADVYGKYLEVQPSVTQKGNWDLAFAGWGADWEGNSARTYFQPLFDGRVFAPSSSNFGDFKDVKVDNLIDQALAAPSVSQATSIWHQADVQVMKDAVWIPFTNPKQANYFNSSKLANFIYFTNYQNGDWTSVYFK
ncbi:MAG TPA: ABC transporter substrate-binding protein [Mycobacteriales bacterium]|nr:ABC transporter substrate-binding protein [Mycobacteriales bacterium]